MLNVQKIQKIAGRVAVLSTTFVVPLAFSIRVEDGFELVQTFGALLYFSFLLFCLFLRPGIPNHKYRSIGLAGLLFIGAGAVSLWANWELYNGSFPLTVIWFLWAPAVLLLPFGSFAPKRKIFVFLVLAGVVGSFYSFAQTFGFDMSGWTTSFGGRSFSTLGNPIFWAGFLLVLLPLAFHLVVSASRNGGRWFWGICLVLLLLSLLATRTRGAWIGLMAEILFAALWTGWRKDSGRRILAVGMLIAVILALVPALRERTFSIFQAKGPDAQGRYFMWHAALRMWKEKPLLGQGPGGYAREYHRVQSDLLKQEPLRPYWTALHAHNEYLDTLAERGLLGALSGVLFAVLLGFYHFRRAREKGGEFSESAAVFAVLSGLAVHSLFHFPFSVVPLAVAFGLSAGVGVEPVKENGERTPAHLWKVVFGMTAIAFTVLAAVTADDLARSSRLNRAVVLLASEKNVEALTLLAKAEPFHAFDLRVHSYRVAALENMGKYDEAEQELRKRLSNDPYDAHAYASLCRVYGQRRRWADSLQAAQKALAIAPSYESALNNLAMSYFAQGKKKESAAVLERLVKALEYQGDADRAEKMREKIKKILAFETR